MRMDIDMDKVYDPKAVESDVYRRWLERGVFHADPAAGGKTYCIVIPPPNVTDKLHVGHALNNTLQDILVRQKRMDGHNTLWMPGTDHAGIATQTVVEKRILAEEGRRRTDFDREEFVGRVQQWKDEYEQRILGQLRSMGCSCDWDRTRFTMDEICARAVRTAFFRLFADGLIYRGKRLVNWDPATQTVLADDEVEHETVQGHFWYMRYPLVEPVRAAGETIEHVTVATTRPETMLGDTAVAINPNDPRAEALRAKKVRLPIVGREIPIVADDMVVLPDADSSDEKARFSTGFLKVTPAHDPTDWEIGLRHELPVVNVFAPDGCVSDRHGWEDADAPEAQALLGMDRFEAREAIVEWFRKEGLLEEVREYAHEVGHSYRSHVPIEPYLSDQWFIAVKKQIPSLPDEGLIAGTDVPANSLAGLALAPVLDGRVRFTPARYAATYRAWLENLRDWPISRQLWWGHRIPIWSCDLELPEDVAPEPVEGHEMDARQLAALARSVGGDWHAFFEGQGAYHVRVEPHPEEDGLLRGYLCPESPNPDLEARLGEAGWRQDPDVLDTWFSSGLWPISTMGWPEETDLLKRFYPTSLLCTAREIITLWVSRMVMFGQYFRGQVPFADVYIHAMIQDGEGRKMSKSLGNGIDPLDIIDSHGADAMRFTLAQMTTETQDVRMPVKSMTLPDGRQANTSPKFDIGRNFCNKLWNASRFALMNLSGAPAWGRVHPGEEITDRWILSRVATTVRDVTGSLSAYRFNEAVNALYRTMWNDFCDWYLEIAKVRMAAGEEAPKAVLAHILDALLRLLHPIVPFVTEAVWAQLNAVAPIRGPGDLPAEEILAAAAWPRAQSEWIDPDAEAQVGAVRELISGIREARSRHNVPAADTVPVTVVAAGDEAGLIERTAGIIRGLAGVSELAVDASARPSGTDATVVDGNIQALVHDVIDIEAERSRLTKRLETLQRGIKGAAGKLANAGFTANAPAEVVERERQRLEEMRAEEAAVKESLKALE